MKKVILSLSLIFSFAIYTFYVRTRASEVPIVPVTLVPETGEESPNKVTPAPKRSPEPNPTPVTLPLTSTGKYKDGNYTGPVADAYYGNVQVKVVVSGGKLIDVKFLDHPHARQTSVFINSRAMPYLISEAITLQDYDVDTVSGASFTSAAFRESLKGALSQARV